jgi:predicted Zn-ribbon and HTH transcriptional regulator
MVSNLSHRCRKCGAQVEGHATASGGWHVPNRCPICAAQRNQGADHPGWKGGRHLNSEGYVAVRTGTRHYDLEHRLVWTEAHGPIPDGYIIHHKNRDRTDNRLENLQMLPQGLHRRGHRGDRWARAYDECQGCGTTERAHAARGLCQPCYWRSRHPEPMLVAEDLTGKQWSRTHAACIDCGRTDRPHNGKGRCSRCSIRHWHQEHERRYQNSTDLRGAGTGSSAQPGVRTV